MSVIERYDKVLLINTRVIEDSLLGSVTMITETAYYVDPESLRGCRTWDLHTYDLKTLKGKNAACRDFELHNFDGKWLDKVLKMKCKRDGLIEKLLTHSNGTGITTIKIEKALKEMGIELCK
jgi:hypothetical protein